MRAGLITPSLRCNRANVRGSRFAIVLGRAGLVIGSVLTALLLAELLVRLLRLDPEALPVRPTGIAVPALEPIARDYANTVDGQAVVEVRTNRYALRDWEHPANEAIRVLGLGDSFTFGFGVELEETYLSVAERALWRRAPPLDVGIHKLGMNGTSQYAQLVVLPHYLSAIDPKIVVLGFSEDTDIDENLVQDPLLERILRGERSFEVSGAAARGALHKWSALARFFRARRLRDAAARDVAAFDRVIESWGANRPEFSELVRSGWQRRFIDAFGDKLDGEWQVTELLLDRMRSEIEARGARLVILRVPSRYAVDPVAWDRRVRDVCGDDPRTVATACGTLDPEHTAKRLRSYAEAWHLPYVDPAPALKAAIARGEAVYFPLPEIHWNRVGHAHVGRVLAEALAGPLSLGESQAPTSAAAGKPRRFGALWTPPGSGDLSASTWIPALRGDERRARSQALLWAEEAGADFLVLKTAFDGRAEWVLDGETQKMEERLLDERQIGTISLGIAFLPAVPSGAPASLERNRLDALLGRIQSLGPAYARACGRPLLFVGPGTDVRDDRFVLVRIASQEGVATENFDCEEQNHPTGDATCPEASRVLALCVRAVREGRGFPGDPDLVIAADYSGSGSERIEPRPPEGRLTTMMVGEAITRWKFGEPGDRAPGERAVDVYRSWLPLGLGRGKEDRRIGGGPGVCVLWLLRTREKRGGPFHLDERHRGDHPPRPSSGF